MSTYQNTAFFGPAIPLQISNTHKNKNCTWMILTINRAFVLPEEKITSLKLVTRIRFCIYLPTRRAGNQGTVGRKTPPPATVSVLLLFSKLRPYWGGRVWVCISADGKMAISQ
jgi:hypothetical protein